MTEPMHCDHECRCIDYINGWKIQSQKKGDPCKWTPCIDDTRTRGPTSGEKHVKVIRELRNALFVSANRYHDLHNRCACAVQNELQFRSLVESALSESEKFKPEYETGDPLDWRRRHE